MGKELRNLINNHSPQYEMLIVSGSDGARIIPGVNPNIFSKTNALRSLIVICLLSFSSLFFFSASPLHKALTSRGSVSSCIAGTDIAGTLFLDPNANGLKDEALYTGIDGTLDSTVGGSSGSSTGNGIDGYAFPVLAVGANTATSPSSIWGPRTAYSNPSNPNTANKTQPTADITGITVKLYNSANALISTLPLDSEGGWVVANASSSLPLRAEYSNLPTGYTYSNAMNSSTGQRQVITTTGCSYDAGYSAPSQYCQNNPTVVVACSYRSGWNAPGILGLPYNASEKLNDTNADGVLDSTDATADSSSTTKLPTSGTSYSTSTQTGPLFGLAYHKQSKMLFASSVTSGTGGFLTGQPRSIDFYGPSGVGGIYKVNTSSGSPSASPFYTVTGVTVGTTYPTSIGTTGLGGMDVSADGTALYTVDLANKTLVTLALTGINTSSVSVTSQSSVSIPDPGCTINGSDTFQPFSVKVWHGSIYVGTVCTYQQKGFVQKYNGSTWSTIFTSDSVSMPKIGGQTSNGGIYTDLGYYQPFFITGLDFDTDGSLIIGTSAGTGGLDHSAGEIYIAPVSGSGFGTPNVTQPGGLDFGDNTGGIATLPGTGQFIAGAANPSTNMSNGLVWYNSSAQQAAKKYSVYKTDVTTFEGSFAESNGLGEIELICDSAPIQIGGRIWNDGSLNSAGNDGISEPNENTIAGVTAHIYTSADVLIGTTTTDSHGGYFFGGASNTNLTSGQSLTAATSYKVRFDNPTDYTTGNPLDQLTLTTQNVAGGTSFSRSAAATQNSYPEISYTTGAVGDNVSTLDAGFVSPEDLSVTTAVPTIPITSPTDPPTTPTEPATTPTEPATTPTEPATTPTEPATTPTEPATTPTEPATTPTEPATTPTTPVTTPNTSPPETTPPVTAPSTTDTTPDAPSVTTPGTPVTTPDGQVLGNDLTQDTTVQGEAAGEIKGAVAKAKNAKIETPHSASIASSSFAAVRGLVQRNLPQQIAHNLPYFLWSILGIVIFLMGYLRIKRYRDKSREQREYVNWKKSE